MRRAAVVLCLLVAASGCASAPGRSEVGGIPVVAEEVHRAGSSLPDGFEVAEGTALVGTTFPVRCDTSRSGERNACSGWTALLLVTGQPEDVLDAYRSQASSLGLTTEPCSDPGPCVARESAEPRTFLGIECNVSGRDRSGRRLIQMFLRRTPRNAARGGVPISHLLLTATTVAEPFPNLGTPAPQERRLQARVVEESRPSEWADLPHVGDRLGAGYVGRERGLVLVPGSKLLSPPGGDSSVTAALRPDEPTYLSIHRCND